LLLRPASAQAQDAVPAAAGPVQFGVQTPPQHTAYQPIVDVWKGADDLGYDSAFVFDHFMPIREDPNGPCFEGWTLLAGLAPQTQRLKVGVLVTGNTYRTPGVLAKMAATVDHISNGRLIFGIGAGWFELEHTAYGIPFYTAGGRARRLVEAVEVIKMLFTQQKSTYNGKYYTLEDAPFQPRTVQKPHPPILIGGMGPKVIQPLAARHADIWHFFVREGGAEEAKKACEQFDAICRKVGRDPTKVQKSITLRPPQLGGPPKEVRQQVQSFVDAGVSYFIIGLPPPYDRQVIRRFAKEVMPAFRET
jgi:F420-dependent oxidoreductase-like protein